MYYSKGAAIRLCWLLSFFFSCIQCQFLSNSDIAAKLDELRAHGVPIDLDGSLADRLTGVSYLACLRASPTVMHFANIVKAIQGGKLPEGAQYPHSPPNLRPGIPESAAPASTLAAGIEVPEGTTPPSTIAAASEISMIPAPPSPLPAALETAFSSALSAAIAMTESLALPSVLPVAMPSLASSFVYPASTLRAAIPTPEPYTSNFIDEIAPSISATATTSTSITVLVVPTPDLTPAEENNTPAAASEPTSTTSDTTMGPMAVAGVGVGLTFGVLSVAGVAGFFLYRRRQNQRHDDANNDPDNSEESNILRKLFGRKKYNDNKGDPEWSIESAEKVAISQNMRAQSVRTTSRTDSRGSDGSKSGTGSDVSSVKRSVMPQRKKLEMPNTALGSHPITPDISSFPLPPTSLAADVKASESTAQEEKKANWPLPG